MRADCNKEPDAISEGAVKVYFVLLYFCGVKESHFVQESHFVLEVEKDLSLTNSSLVDGKLSPEINGKVRLNKMVVCLHQNFMAKVPEKVIRHSEELVFRKRAAEHEGTISLLVDALQSILE